MDNPSLRTVTPRWLLPGVILKNNWKTESFLIFFFWEFVHNQTKTKN
jgi:hypothetical protein